MTNYIIIGGDRKEYGPITSEDVRQWIKEGRLNGSSLAKAESDAEFRPLEKFPEFADILGGGTPGTIAPLSSSTVSEDDYELDIGGCVSSGWEAVKKNFGTLFVCFLVMFGIQIGLSSILNFAIFGTLSKMFPAPAATLGISLVIVSLNSLVIGPLLGGFYLIYLKTLRGESSGVGDIFVGFQKAYLQLFLGSLFIGLVSSLCLAPFTYVVAEKVNPIVQKLQALQGQGTAPTEVTGLLSQMFAAYGAAVPVFLVCLIPMTYLTVCWQFTIALIIDKQLDLGAAISIGWKRVNRHWWQVFGLTILVGLVSFSGLIGCGIGILFTIPIGCAAIMSGYETIFSAKKH